MPTVRIPHRPPLRFLAESCACVGDWVLVAATVPADGPAARSDRTVEPGYLIEVAAQATAAWAGSAEEAVSPDQPRGGMLVAIKDWRWLAPAPVDTVLAVRARRAAVLGDLAQFECEIALAGAPIAAGVLTVARAP